VETLAEFNVTVEHRPGRLRLHDNADGVSRMFCKQCFGKQAKVSWTNKLERTDKMTKPLSVHSFELHPKLSDSDMAKLQAKGPTLFPVIDGLSTGTTPTFKQLKVLPVDLLLVWLMKSW